MTGGVTQYSAEGPRKPNEWPVYGGDAGGLKYSPLTSIDRSNVARLSVAWTWKTGEQPIATTATTLAARPGQFQVTPLAIGDTLYLSTPFNRVDRSRCVERSRALVVRSESVRDGAAVERNRIRPPRRRHLERRKGTPDSHRKPVAVDRARREDRNAHSVIRHQRRGRSHGEHSLERRSAALHEHVAACRVREPRDRRQRRWGPAGVQARPTGRRAGVRRSNRAARVAIQSHSAARRVRPRDVGGQLVGADGPHERVGAVHGGRWARARVLAIRHTEQRLVRRRAEGGQPVRGKRGLPRRANGPTRVALSDHPPWCVGLRPAIAARARDHSTGQSPARRRGDGGEAGDGCSCSIA